MIKYVVLSLGEILSNENYDENLIINARVMQDGKETSYEF